MTNILISQSAVSELVGKMEQAISNLQSLTGQIEDQSHAAFDSIPQVPEWNEAVDSALSAAKEAGKAKGQDLAADGQALIRELENLVEQVRQHANEQFQLNEETAAAVAALDANVG